MSKSSQKDKLVMLIMLAFFVALYIVLAKFLAFENIAVRISIGNIALFLAAMLYGPVAGAVVAVVADFLGTMLKGGLAWLPQLAVATVLMSAMAGLIWKYISRTKASLITRVSVSVFVPTILCKMILQTFILVWSYSDNTFFGILPIRIAGEGITSVIVVAVITALYKAAPKVIERLKLKGNLER